MKVSVNVIRVFVGLVFIFSGLVKANDPLGTAYKMEDYFEIWNGDLEHSSFFMKNALMGLFNFFNEHTLFLSVTMNAFEIIAGAALLLGWRMKLFSWLLLLLMIFFTILTGYTFKTGNPKNCGCFGDCIRITSEFSFYKDLLLSAFILVILFARKHIKPLFSPKLNTGLMFGVTLFSFGLQWYALKYLPPVDCLPYKKGNSIPEKMKMPANAVQEKKAITFVYIKDGAVAEYPIGQVPKDIKKQGYIFSEETEKELGGDSVMKVAVYVKGGKKGEFPADNFPADYDSTYTIIDRREDVIVKAKNNTPPIAGLTLIGETITDTLSGSEVKPDLTDTILSMPNVLLLFNTENHNASPMWKDELLALYSEANKNGIPFYFVATDRDSTTAGFAKMGFQSIKVVACDIKIIRAAARANPTLYFLKNGVVAGKWSYANFDDAKKAILK